ncbi:diguanylate cyclase [Spirochaeta isovalerica]|uniref:diguanylate cyclase n=1 Tax=Spirochaeta isovalerica TaxID=150 RepID=A0A841RI77_9SPIO|nr:diguanylate cyclase (GGDEF)-like protein [Spirochaeta isovalerica]
MNDKSTLSSILVVDDDPAVSQLIQCILTEEQYAVETASDGREALARDDLKTFDLFILDINMPAMNGYSLCTELKNSYEMRDTPVIFLTGNILPEDKVKGFECGAIDYITKPFNGSELIARVRNHLEVKHNRDYLKQMALTDGLTQLYNHSYIHERLVEEISYTKRHELNLSLIMFDLDNFKLVNDTFGHKQGDKVLQKVSRSIKDIIREEDVAGRYGGEEFIIILPNTDHVSAFKVAEKIRKSVKNLKWDNRDMKITLSGGVSTLSKESINEFIEKTDVLLYKAKHDGKDKIISAVPVMN